MKKRVIVIGLDGMEPTIVEALLRQGRLPHFEKIQKRGLYRRLETTYPALTPVAWSSFVTGANPGAHGIFDFISRDPLTYRPDLSLSRFEQPKNMFVGPKVVNRRKGVPFWNLLTAADVPCTVLRCPCTFPPDPIKGNMLAGVGVPDLRGSQGTGTFYTQDHSVGARENEQIVHLNMGREFTTHVIGPRNTKAAPPTDCTAELRVTVGDSANAIGIRVAGSTDVELRLGAWSPWLRVKFKFSLLQSATGLVRFYLRQVSPHVEFYASPVNFDAAAPLFPISSPPQYSGELAHHIGLFGTLGMAEDHGGLNNGRFDEDAYLAQCKLVLDERERMMFFELDRLHEGVVFVVFDTPDRVQHMFWRFRDRQHPCFEPERAGLSERIEEHYEWYDAMLSRVSERVDENTLLIVLSDHGFTAFRRAFHVNTWLFQNGLLALTKGRHADGNNAEPFEGVDWSRTYAYALGMTGVYLNMKGRESRGILEEGSQAESVRTAIQRGLTGLVDRETEQVAVTTVLRREQIYSGAYVADSPDLLLNCTPGFRVSWQTALGGMTNQLFEDNTQCWSGDHIVDRDSVPGILFMNRETRRERVTILDLAPTILAHLGIPKVASMEGQSLI